MQEFTVSFPKSIILVTFDAVGTLICPDPSVGAVYQEIFAEHGIDARVEDVESRFRHVFGQFENYRVRHPVTADDREFWKAIVCDTVAPWSTDFLQQTSIFERLYAAFGEGRRWQVLPGVFETLESLKSSGRRLALLSNADQRFHNVMEALKLRSYFEQVFLSGEVGYEKPDVRIFQYVEQVCQVDPLQICHVGDSIKHDIEGARAAGWHAFYIGNNGCSLTELIKQLV